LSAHFTPEQEARLREIVRDVLREELSPSVLKPRPLTELELRAGGPFDEEVGKGVTRLDALKCFADHGVEECREILSLLRSQQERSV
jgi:hypothetical protein